MANQHSPRRVPFIPIGPSIAYIPLTRGQFALIDSGDVELVGTFQWNALYCPSTKSYYATREVPGVGYRNRTGRTSMRMHRLIVGGECPIVDHRLPGRTLDNRRANLRPATLSDNARNARKRRDNTSGYKGASLHRASGRWTAQIVVNRERVHLGTFDTPELAHAAYREAAAKYHGEFARVA